MHWPFESDVPGSVCVCMTTVLLCLLKTKYQNSNETQACALFRMKRMARRLNLKRFIATKNRKVKQMFIIIRDKNLVNGACSVWPQHFGKRSIQLHF